jgi:glycine/D-amino acid oxidase-like deaminating enzyme
MPLATDLPSKTDVAVIGGGIFGTAICYWLARSGVSTILLEQTMLAHGATGRNGGFVSVGPTESYPAAIERFGHDTAQQILAVTLENRALLHQIIAEEKFSCEYREAGHLSLALNSNQRKTFEQSAAALQADNVPTWLLEREEVQERIGTPLGEEIIAGKFNPATALVHSAQLTQGIARAAQRYGAQMCASNVLQLMINGKEIDIHTTSGLLHAANVVVATNAWISELVPSLTSVITPVRGQALAYASREPVFPTAVAVALTDTEEYWKQTVDGTIILGGCRAVAPHHDVGVRINQPTSEVQAALELVFPRLFPQLKGLQVKQRWAGVMAFTPDYLPIVDLAEDIPDIWVAGGFSGNGMAFALRLGQLLADTIVSGTISATLKLFRLHRKTLL